MMKSDEQLQHAYQTLGVTARTADTDVRAAYYALARQYHPDFYHGTDRAEAAQEVMRTINQAYEVIRRDRKKPKPAVPPQRFHVIRHLLSRQDTVRALAALNCMEPHDAAWHAMAAECYATRGWPQRALCSMQQAVTLAPENQGYQTQLHQWTQQTAGTVNLGGRGTRLRDVFY